MHIQIKGATFKIFCMFTRVTNFHVCAPVNIRELAWADGSLVYGLSQLTKVRKAVNQRDELWGTNIVPFSCKAGNGHLAYVGSFTSATLSTQAFAQRV